MMKKMVSIVLCLAFALSLVGCNDQTNGNGDYVATVKVGFTAHAHSQGYMEFLAKETVLVDVDNPHALYGKGKLSLFPQGEQYTQMIKEGITPAQIIESQAEYVADNWEKWLED